MDALLITPGRRDSARIGDVPVPEARAGVLVRTLEVGVCGTDREIAEGLFGAPPPGEDDLVLGHEFLGTVERDGHGFRRGDLVTATVRRSCERCAACRAGAPDACMTGDYRERGITALHGFASELVVEDPGHVVPVPDGLGRSGVLAEPTSICERGLRHVRAIGGRQPWEPQRALVLGAGAIGMLGTYLLRLAGHAVWTAARGPEGSEKAELVTVAGARYVSTETTPPAELAASVGGFDIVLEATGDAQVMAGTLALLRRGGVSCLLGLDPRDRTVELDGRAVGVDTVLQNRALVGSVNAHRTDWDAAVRDLEAVRQRWPEALDRMIGLRCAPDRFEEAMGFRGVKATLRFA